MSEFDSKAKEWDSNPMHFNRSEAIAKSIIAKIPLNPKMTALEYGAGTGILSVMLKDQFAEITLMDQSIEMVKIMKDKAQTLKIKHFEPLQFDLEKDIYTDKIFDVVLTQMVMHHVNDIPLIFKRLHDIIKPDGFIAIADLYAEDGSFHGAGFDGHLGFDPVDLAYKLTTAGFCNVAHELCYIMSKTIDDGSTKEFPIFLMTAKR